MAELLVVVAIIVTLMIALGRGYGQMQKNYRLSNSTEKVLSTLYLARSLAIGNNAVYHVRIQNWHDPNALDTDGNVISDPFSEQWIKVYSFPDLYVALNLVEDDLLKTANGQVTITNFDMVDARIVPGPLATTLATTKVLGDDVLGPDPAHPLFVLPGPNWVLDSTPMGTDKLLTCNVASARMEPQTYLGIQNTYGASRPSRAVLSFNPDGTANTPGSTSMYFYVTDVMTANIQQRTAANDYRDGDPSQDSLYQSRNNIRHDVFNNRLQGKEQGLRMIRVSPSGSIKLLDPTSNGVMDRLPTP